MHYQYLRKATIVIAAAVFGAFATSAAQACPSCPANHTQTDCWGSGAPFPGPAGPPQGTEICGDGYVGGEFISGIGWFISANLVDGLCIDDWGLDGNGDFIADCDTEDTTEGNGASFGSCTEEPSSIEYHAVWCNPN
jgi:hypothetical protein